MPRFAILVHDHPFLHWDFLLEDGSSCRTWRLLASPDTTDQAIPAHALSDHRLLYLDYEGPISGQRGVVTRWDCGSFEWIIRDDKQCEIRVDGSRWNGLFRLSRIDGDRWNCKRYE